VRQASCAETPQCLQPQEHHALNAAERPACIRSARHVLQVHLLS
jgi:hypothetical protein